MKTVIVLAVIVGFAAARFLVQEDDPQGCAIGDPCGEDIDCPCANQNVICNYNQVCAVRRWLDNVVRKKPCFRIFKNKCTSHADCPCDGRLMCEDGECVENRTVSLKARRIRYKLLTQLPL